MNEFKRAREEYESTPIPEELDARVRAGIRQGRTSSRSRGYKVVRRTAGSVAACLAVPDGGPELSPRPSRLRLRMYRCWAGCSRS